jgi:hypothetical protein
VKVQIAADITAVARTVTLGVLTGTTYTPGALDVTADALAITPPTGFANPALQVLLGSNLTITGGGSVNVGTFTVDNFGTINVNTDDSGATLTAGNVHNESGGTINGGLTFATGGTVTNAGQVSGLIFSGATVGNGITVNGGAGNIANTGTITGTTGVSLGDGGSVTNNPGGTISATHGPGVELANGGTLTNNAGATITGATDGVLSDLPFSGVTGGVATAAAARTSSAAVPDSTIVNSGTITGPTGVESDGGGSVTNNAGGIIQGTAGYGIASLVSDAGNPLPLTVVNSLETYWR